MVSSGSDLHPHTTSYKGFIYFVKSGGVVFKERSALHKKSKTFVILVTKVRHFVVECLLTCNKHETKKKKNTIYYVFYRQ